MTWIAVALLALAGFSAMHVGSVTDLSLAGHVVPVHADAGWLDTPPGQVGHPDEGGVGGTDGHASHDHDALLGCLIALTGLGLIAVARRSPSWARRARAEVGRLSSGAVAVVATLAPPERTRLRLQVLRI